MPHGVSVSCDLSTPSFVPKGLEIENQKNGNVLGKTWNKNVLINTADIVKIGLYQSKTQMDGHQISAKCAAKELAKKITLGADVLDSFLINQHLFRWSPVVGSWKTKRIIFSTLYCHPIVHLFLRELFFDGLIWNHQVRPFTEFGPEDYFAILKKLERS